MAYSLPWSHPAWVCGLKLFLIVNTVHFFWSHPAWVCGLKPEGTPYIDAYPESHPAWVCGLKLSSVYSCIYIYCHTLRGCVDWNFAYLQGYRREGSHTLRGCVDWNQKNTGYLDNREVTPCVGVWIETIPLGDILSHYGVTPCVGVWIETRNSVAILAHHKVTPCVGVWIETRNPPLS